MTPTPVEFADALPATMPDHTQLPCEDGAIVQNFMELAQSTLLTGSMTPWLNKLHPDSQFCIGQDCGIYWRYTDPPLDGCKAPDWFYVPGVTPMLKGVLRRSYVMWHEGIKPQIVVEYVSGDGSEERDRTPFKGKFWVYEQGIGAAYYAIYEVARARIELYRLEGTRYVLVPANSEGRYPVEPLGVELGLWQATYAGITAPWLRVWDARIGKMLPSTEEREETANSLLDETRGMLTEECECAEKERNRAEKRADKLRSLGIDPNAI